MIFWLAPMDGITDLAYRTITNGIFSRYNTEPKNQLRTRTEFMNADGYMITPNRLVKHLLCFKQDSSNPNGQKLIAQIYGGNKESLIKTAQDIEQKYPEFDGIELNIGCPSPKVIACGWGSWMMQNKKATLEIIKTISESITKPFSIKVRAWLTNDDKAAQEQFIIDAAAYCPVISIHGRTMKQWHGGDVDRPMLYRIKEHVGNGCTIIGNGWIISYDDAYQKLGNLDGQMIAQAAIANPRIFTSHRPTIRDRYETIINHLSLALAVSNYFSYHQEHTTITEEKQTSLDYNRQMMHQLKKSYNDEDTIKLSWTMRIHEYQFPMPQYDQIMIDAQQIDQGGKPIGDNHTVIEFRKYLFNYLKGIEWAKDIKQHIAQIKNYEQLRELLENFFSSRL